MEPVEIEVKFHIGDVESLRRVIEALGAEDLGEVFETNIRYEDAGDTLVRNRSLLRLRQDNAAILTYKSDAEDADPQYKVRRELEVTVSDFDTMHQILMALGFHKEQIYEKRRRTYKLGDAELCLDAMPFGEFLEIEGPKPAIRSIADKLDLPWENRILTNYLSIFRRVRKDLGLEFTDITFDNFRAVGPVDMSRYLDKLTAG
jgi:adenylate cyclase class 2